MTSQEYTQWLKGFLDAVDGYNGYNITKKQFDTIREKLKEVNDYTGTPIGIGGWGSTNPIIQPYVYSGTTSFSITSGSSTISLTSGTTTTTADISSFTNSVDDEESELLLD